MRFCNNTFSPSFSAIFLLLVGSSILLSPCLSFSNVQPPSTTSSSTTSSSSSSPSLLTDPTTTASTTANIKALHDFDYHSNDRIPWLENGYDTWIWSSSNNEQDYKINYLEMGGDTTKPAILLIHGFGASSYHFRYNIPELARDGYHVYAIDLLGFGLSDKPLEQYSAEIWCNQIVDFIQEIIQKPTIVAGNSLGGFTALYTCTDDTIQSYIKGCVLLNGAGRFRDTTTTEEAYKEPNYFTKTLQTVFQRMIINASFLYTKQPSRIEQVLRQVYPINNTVIDKELVSSIQYPSKHPNAAEVFYRVITKNGSGPVQVYIDDLLQKLTQKQVPLLLCWGEQDPWIRPITADKIQSLYPSAQRVSINAGHCPHDEAAPEVNAAIKEFAKQCIST